MDLYNDRSLMHIAHTRIRNTDTGSGEYKVLVDVIRYGGHLLHSLIFCDEGNSKRI